MIRVVTLNPFGGDIYIKTHKITIVVHVEDNDDAEGFSPILHVSKVTHVPREIMDLLDDDAGPDTRYNGSMASCQCRRLQVYIERLASLPTEKLIHC